MSIPTGFNSESLVFDEQTQINHSKQVVERILNERRRQYEHHGWTPEHDDEHENSELARAAMCYAFGSVIIPHHYENKDLTLQIDVNLNPFEAEFAEAIGRKSEIRRLEIAGAFIVAEIERLERAHEFDSIKIKE